MSQHPTRQQLYDRIRASSKDSVILAEMKRLGFWEDSPQPTLPETLIAREATLQKELNDLLTTERRFQNSEQVLVDMRKDRMRKSKEKQAENKARRLEERRQKAEQWQQTKTQDIIYLGEGVSAGLQAAPSDLERLQSLGLPIFENVLDLAQQMGIPLPKLRFLAFERKIAKVCHYSYFQLPKKSGGLRRIAAPKPLLKQAQQWIMTHILYQIPNKDCVHGFVPERSILSNAQPHLGQEVVINLDLKDFFPSISYARVKGLFVKLGYSEQLATILALLCTHAETKAVTVDGEQFFVQEGERRLVQGSPASPALSNLIAHKLDKRLEGLAAKYGFTYTRYADDLTFSAPKADEPAISALLAYVKRVVREEGFALHPDKTHLMRKGAQHKVTGVVVNEKPSVDRKQLHKFRALLHQIDQTGWEGKQWGNTPNIVHSVQGYANFVAMVNPEKGQKFVAMVKALIAKHPAPPLVLRYTPAPEQPPADETHSTQPAAPTSPASPQKPESDWWDVLDL
ncbi:reverse transcriptase family protein [Eisenibacter elegans]|uniref:reverse transcriptase family protein n=1 Tax=Eisenibacter elegans TaxID=997 RepID=UPI0003F70EC3|nr:reverse transcriptase family protein [Eisenibacter elegans]